MKRFRVLTAALCAAVLLCGFSTTAYAGGGEEFVDGTGGYDPEPPVVEEPKPEPNPFTPEGTGTVVDNATDEDGKEFFTITTPNENIFFLVIDRQRSGENVYFLNAVTEADLMALAEITEEPPAPEPEPEPPVAEEPQPEPKSEKKSNPGMILLVLAVLGIGGGAGWYFKVYRPKQEKAAGPGEDYDEELEDYDDPEDDLPPWDEEEEYTEDTE